MKTVKTNYFICILFILFGIQHNRIGEIQLIYKI